MKIFIINTLGYTAGIYGKTNDYYQLIVINGEEMYSWVFCGLYGADYRVASVLKENGFEQKHPTNPIVAKLTRKDLWKGILSEYEIIENIKVNIK